MNLTENSYNGNVTISVLANEKFEYIVLHAADMLTVELKSVVDPNGVDVAATIFRYKPYSYVVLEFEKEQSEGAYTLMFDFKASFLDTGLSGLYISNYTENGEKHKIASTQFQFYDARKVFPCFDDPAFKTTFDVSIMHDKDMVTTLSNMQKQEGSIVSSDNLEVTKYKQTLKMTTYLLAMLVSDFVCQTSVSNNVTYGVCASRVKQNKTQYALEVAPKILEEIQTLLDYKNPLMKIDLIAVPDFHYGAMENWGLITFRELALLHSDDDTEYYRKLEVSSIVAHEIAHFVC